MSPESEKYIKGAVAAKMEDLTSAINSIHDSLTDISNLSKPRIPEEIFIKEILPYACGEMDSQEGKAEFRRRHLTMFGSLDIPVDVVGKKGELLFTIPPIVTTGFITVIRSDDTASYSEMVKYASLLGNQTSHAQANFLNASLGQKGDEIAEKQKAFGSSLGFDAWVSIFKRYDKKEALAKMLSTSTGDVKNNTPTSFSSDDLEYDFEEDD